MSVRLFHSVQILVLKCLPTIWPSSKSGLHPISTVRINKVISFVFLKQCQSKMNFYTYRISKSVKNLNTFYPLGCILGSSELNMFFFPFSPIHINYKSLISKTLFYSDSIYTIRSFLSIIWSTVIFESQEAAIKNSILNPCHAFK